MEHRVGFKLTCKTYKSICGAISLSTSLMPRRCSLELFRCAILQVLWRQFLLIELAGNYRAAADPAFAELLSRVRVGHPPKLRWQATLLLLSTIEAMSAMGMLARPKRSGSLAIAVAVRDTLAAR
jgi:hypothetical protein